MSTTNTFTVGLNGKTFNVDADVFDNVELLDIFRRMQAGDATLTLQVIRSVFGGDSDAVLDALRDDAGKVRFAAVAELFEKLFAEAAPNS